MISLLLYDRLAEGTDGYRGDITRHAQGWTRSIRAIGGFWMGDFFITPETMGRIQMINFYNSSIGRRIVEKTAGITTWEGEFVRMDLTIDGVTYIRTMDVERWHNKVKTRYGGGDETAWSEETGSSDIYGESCLIDILSIDHDSTSATAWRDRLLIENAYPRSRASGGLSSGLGVSSEDRLHVICGGYVYSMNRRYYASDSAAAAISTQISTLVAASEFVTAGRIDTNSDTMPITCAGMPGRLWDLIEELIEAGDGSGNRWVGGCYEGREFHYQQAETAVTHYWRGSRLLNLGGVPVLPSMIRPDIIVEISNAPGGATPPGGNTWDSPRRPYIEEVEFIAPASFRMIPRE